MIGEEERRLSGVSDGLIRLSVGIEDSRDLTAEIDRALEA
jgi:cystathionine beta-lyase/cystathionine gamma-synthase